MVEFRLLGPLEVVEGDRRISLGGPKQRALLAALLLRRNQVVSGDRIIDTLWGETPPHTAAATVRVYVSNLRKAIGSETLVTRGGGYLLAVGPDQLDVTKFERLVLEGRSAIASGDAQRARNLFAEALALWRGEPLADLAYESFVQPEVARLHEIRLSALEDRLETDLAIGRHRELVGEIEELNKQHPHRERLIALLMLALYHCGRQVDALEVYATERATLADELGLEPGPALRSLELKILNHDPELGTVPIEIQQPGGRPNGPRKRGRTLVALGGLAMLLAAGTAGIVESQTASSVLAAANTVAAIDTSSGHVSAVVGVGAAPGSIAFGSGALWIANVDDRSVSRVDPVSLATVRTIAFDQAPTGIAATDAGVWVVSSNSKGLSVPLNRINPLYDTVEHVADVGNIALGAPVSVAAQGPSVWVAPLAGDLTQFDAHTGAVQRRVDPNGGPVSLAVGEGAVWVTDSEADTVTRVDSTGVTRPIPVGHTPEAIAVGAGGVWVADTGDNAVVRIDPQTSAVTATIHVGAAPLGIAVGAGFVWVADSGDGTVTRVDPTSLRASSIPVGGSPQHITVAQRRAWVTVDQPVIVPSASREGGTLRLDSASDVDYMDTALAYSLLSWQLLDATCASLVRYTDSSGPSGPQLVPEVAQSLPSVSADGLSYTFTIRNGFRFSPPSNEPVTAATFKYTIERTLNPVLQSPVANQSTDIAGADDYMSGRTTSVSGLVARGNVLTIRLTKPVPDLIARLAQPFFCAVPLDTPADPNGLHVIPSAGPYYVASYTPRQGVVLLDNPNYGGDRPHHFARIEMRVNVPSSQAVADVESGRADYALDGEIQSDEAAVVASRYGPGSEAARAGHQQYFVNPASQLDFIALNTQRPLFASPQMRQAVNYAIDRSALAQLGGGYGTFPDQPTEDYLPPGVPGHTDLRAYPLTPDVAMAKGLVGSRGATSATLYICDQPRCAQQGQVIATDLAAIGLQVQVKAFPTQTLYAKLATPGEPFDLAIASWAADYLDPDNFFNLLLMSGTILPSFDDPVVSRQISDASRLTGPDRYLAYAKIDADLVRNGAPWIAFGNGSTHELLGSDIGCEVQGRYGMDLGALCLRTGRR